MPEVFSFQADAPAMSELERIPEQTVQSSEVIDVDESQLVRMAPQAGPRSLNLGGISNAGPTSPGVLSSGGNALVPKGQSAMVTRQDISDEADIERMREILLKLGVKEGHVNIALRRRKLMNESMASIMADFGFLSGDGVALAVSQQSNLPLFKAEDIDTIDVDHFENITLATFQNFVPVKREGERTLFVAVSDPSQITEATNAFVNFGVQVKPMIASSHTIQQVYRKYFANTEEKFDAAVEGFIKNANNSSKTRHTTSGAAEAEGEVGKVSDIYFAMLRHACYAGASDVYLYKSDKIGILKLKINGVGQLFRTLPLELYTRLLNKLVQDNGGKTDELRNKPKEAVVEIKGDDKIKHSDLANRFGFRLELAETRGDRTAVIRILDKNAAATDLENLGFDEQTYKSIAKASRSATGFFLVTGPTGSGKTTSLYAILKSIDAVERSIQSIENPIEYRHGLWQQYEVRKNSDNEADDYNLWLKALLRNAPDVILVGEVRDQGVAEICLNAANTGHLVFATLHTNDATLAVARLKALHVDMDVLGSVLLGVLAQRLTRVLCEKCKVEDTDPETVEALKEEYLASEKKTPFKAGPGCVHCQFTGYRGRRMVYELLEMNANVRRALETGEPPSIVAAHGMETARTMWANGMRLVCRGATSLQELQRIATKAF